MDPKIDGRIPHARTPKQNPGFWGSSHLTPTLVANYHSTVTRSLLLEVAVAKKRSSKTGRQIFLLGVSTEHCSPMASSFLKQQETNNYLHLESMQWSCLLALFSNVEPVYSTRFWVPEHVTQRLLCSSFLVVTYIFFLGIIIYYPKRDYIRAFG